MSASRRARLERLRRVAQKRVLAAELELASARSALDAARAVAQAAEEEVKAALGRWGDVASADELAAADARRLTLAKLAARARAVAAERARDVTVREEALVAERQGEMRLEKVLERLASIEAAKATTRERRAGDEHAARLVGRRDAEHDTEETHP